MPEIWRALRARDCYRLGTNTFQYTDGPEIDKPELYYTLR